MEKIVVGNLKSFITDDNIKDYIEKMNFLNLKNIKFILCPSFIHLSLFKNKKYCLGAQNVFYDEGAYTGEISSKQLKSIGVEYVIVGHQERRKYFKESNSDINLKVLSCLKENLKVIICIGEEIEGYSFQKLKTIIENQITEIFKNINSSDINNIILAYEPAYSIGTAKILNIEKINSTILYIKDTIFKLYGCNINVIYGGSVSTNNINNLLKISDGVIVGKMSSECEKFVELLKNINI